MIAVSKPKIYIKLALGLVSMSFIFSVILYFLMKGGQAIVSFGWKYGMFFLGIALLMAAIMSYILKFYYKIFKLSAKILNLSIILEDKVINIKIKNNKFKIYKDDIERIISNPNSFEIIWQTKNSKLKTFDLKRRYFTKSSWNNLVEKLSDYECFSDDKTQNSLFKRGNGLDHIFRKNKLEYEL